MGDALMEENTTASTQFVRKTKAQKKAERKEKLKQRRNAQRDKLRERRRHASDRARAARDARLAAMGPEERASHLRAEEAARTATIDARKAQLERVDSAHRSGLRVAVDLAYAGEMSAEERISLARQLGRCWNCNRTAAAPVSLHLTNLARCPADCLFDNTERWRVHRVEEDVAEHFALDELVFLTPDADEALTELDPSKVYVIGGLVDRTVRKKQSLTRARLLGARTFRFPLAEYAPHAMHDRIPLTLNATLHIITERNAGVGWAEAIETALPPRYRAVRRVDQAAGATVRDEANPAGAGDSDHSCGESATSSSA